jgi:hypothetical protein
MALDFQPIHVNFGEGVDTHSDSKAVVSAKLLHAQNVVFTAPGSLRTRFGWEQTITNAAFKALGKRDDEILYCTDRELYPQNRLAKWLTGQTGVQRRALLRRPAATAFGSDCAIVGNIAVTAVLMYVGAAAAADKVWILVTRVDTKETVRIRQDAFASNARHPRCVAVGDSVWILALNAAGTQIDGVLYNTTSDSFTATLAVGGAAIDAIDACPMDATSWALGYIDAGAGAIYSQVRALGGGITTSATRAVTATTGVAVLATPGEHFYMLYENDASGDLEVTGWTLPSHASAFVATQMQAAPFPTAGIGNGVRLALSRLSSTSAMAVWADYPTNAPRSIRARSISSAGAAGPVDIYFRRNLQSKPWVHDGVTRVLVGYESDLQGTTYVQQLNPVAAPTMTGIVARQFGGCAAISSMAGGQGVVTSVPETATDGVFLAPIFVKQKILQAYVSGSFGFNAESIGVDLVTLDHVSTKRFCTAELGGLTYIAGGILLWYDGTSVGEAGFLYFPEQPTLTASAGGAVTLGAHQYVVIWAYTDAAGNVHRSAPSTAASITVGAGNQVVTAAVQPLNMSQRDLPNTDPASSRTIAEWYGTVAASAGPFYRVHAPLSCTENVVTQEGTFNTAGATQADATLAANPQLYTTGNVLANFPPPSTDVICTHQNRLCLVSAEDGRIWFSKEYIVGEAPGFNDILSFTLPTDEMPVAMASFDDKLIIWTANQIHVLAGDFPNDTGAGSTLHSQRLASDVGAIDWRSVVVTHLGAIFASTKGIMLLTRGLQVLPAGYDVSYWTDNYTECTAAIVTPDRDEVRFHVRSPLAPIITPTAQTLVLNFRGQSQNSPYGQWSHFDDSFGDTVSAVVVGGSIYRLGDDGVVHRETTAYSDAGAWITVDVETANIYPFGRQASGRVRTATLLGETEGSHALELQVAYDDDPVFSESAYFDAADLGLLAREQVGHHLSQQKCSGVRFRITTYSDGPDDDGDGLAGMPQITLSGIVMEAAQKRGSADRRMPKEARQ